MKALSIAICLLLPLKLAWAQVHHLNWDEPNRNSIRGGKYIDLMYKHDRKRTMYMDFDPYWSEEMQLEKKDALRRIKRFSNTILSDYINKKYKIFSRSWGNSKTEIIAEEQENFEVEGQNNFVYEVSYKVRSRRMQLDFFSNLFNFKGVFHYSGESEFEVSRDIGISDIKATYVMRPKEKVSEIALEKHIIHNIKAKTSFGNAQFGDLQSGPKAKKFQVFYNANF